MAKRVGRPPKAMQIKYKISMARPDRAISPGDVEEVDSAEGARLIEAGFAEAVSKVGEGKRQATA